MGQNAEPLVEKVELYPYLEALWKARYFILGLTFLAVLLTFLLSRWFSSPVYEASGLVQVGQLGTVVLSIQIRNKTIRLWDQMKHISR